MSPPPRSAPPANGRNRRVSLIAIRPGEGRLTEPRAGAQPERRELVFMPKPDLGSAQAECGRAIGSCHSVPRYRVRGACQKRELAEAEAASPASLLRADQRLKGYVQAGPQQIVWIGKLHSDLGRLGCSIQLVSAGDKTTLVQVLVTDR